MIVQILYNNGIFMDYSRHFDEVRHNFALWQARSGSVRVRTALCSGLNLDSACRTQHLPTVIWLSLDRLRAAPVHPVQVPHLTGDALVCRVITDNATRHRGFRSAATVTPTLVNGGPIPDIGLRQFRG